MKINSCLLFALLVLLVSYTLAIDTSQKETTTEKDKEAAVADKVEAKDGGGKYGVNYGGGGGNYGGGGGSYGGGGSGWGGNCHHGCCNRGHGGSCSRCCASPEEAKAFAEKQLEAKESVDASRVDASADGGKYGVNYGGGGGGGNYGGGGGNYGGGGGGWGGGSCHHGCCNRGHGGSCSRCCASPEEAKAFAEKQMEAKESADANKVVASADGGKYGVNYGGGGGNYGGGGGGGNYGGGGGGWGGNCHHGCCNRGHGGSCSRCCTSPEEAKALAENQSEAKESTVADKAEASGGGKYGVNYGGGNYGGGGGNYGGGGGNYGGGGGGGWGGQCHHGCCNRGHGGSCSRCCTSQAEAKAFAENQSRP